MRRLVSSLHAHSGDGVREGEKDATLETSHYSWISVSERQENTTHEAVAKVEKKGIRMDAGKVASIRKEGEFRTGKGR